MINASARNFRIEIAASDVTAYVTGFEARCEDNGAGLFPTKGTLKLRRPIAGTLDLNNRTNREFWQRGQPVLVDLADQSGTLRRFFTLRILQASYDPSTLEQECAIGCDLSLIDYSLVRDCEIADLDVGLGGSLSKTTFVNQILAYFGLQPMIGTIPDAVGKPIIGDSASLAQLAGKLAFDAGKTLWVNSQGRVTVVSRQLTQTY